MLRIRIILLLATFSIVNSYSQEKKTSYDLNSTAGYTTNGHVPFWLRSNQYGSVPLDNASLSLTGAAHKDYKTNKKRFIDWGVSFEGRANIGNKLKFTLIDGHGKVRIGIFEIRAGRSKEITGLCDSSLSSGSFSVSGNTLGIPKIEIKIHDFYSIPILHKILAFKGNYAHGWIGKTLVDNIQVETYLHQSSLYGRFGKPEWKFKLYGGFNHQALWGNEKESYGPGYAFSPFKTYLYVIRGGTYIDGYTRLGDHLGSIDLGFEYDFKSIRLLVYRQNLYEAGALYYLANIRDGLNGISLINLHNRNEEFQWRKILVEVFYTKSQGGESWSVPRPSAAEDYYNHYQYIRGWSYNGVGIGNPFISSPLFLRKELLADTQSYFDNNRIAAFHIGFEGSANHWNFVLKTSYSLNYGTYNTINTFGEKKQFSAFLETNKELRKGLNVGFTGAFDVGELYYNSVGVMVRVGKRF